MSSLRNEAIKGMSWSAIEKFASQAIAFVLGIIMAPSDYGTIGMLAIFMGIAGTVADSGFGSALIQKKDKTPEDYSTFFLFNLGISIVLYLILFFSAPWIAEFYHTPILKDVTRVVTLQLILNALFNAQNIKIRIELKFKEMSIASLVSQIFTGAVGVFLAFLGWGVWALVWQALFSCLIRGFLSLYILKGWTPGIRFSKDSFHALFGFGSKILVSSLINTIYGNLYTLIIGRKFTPNEVGYYNRGAQLASFPSTVATDMIVSVNYPILSRLQDDNPRLIQAYKKMLTLPLFVLYPAIVGLGVLAEPVVGLLLKEKWLPCVPFLQIMCFGSVFSPLTSINLNLLYVKGRTDLVLKLELIKKPIGFAIIFITMNFGIYWLMAGKALYEFIAFSFNCHFTGKILGYGWKEQMHEILPILLKTCFMGLVVYLVCLLLTGWWAKLIIGTLTGIITYALIAFVTKDNNLKEIILVLKDYFKR